MSLNSFSPNTVIKSAEHNANWSNFSSHGRNFVMRFGFGGNLVTGNGSEYIELSDAGTIERVDLLVGTVPTGAAIIVDIEYSDDDGASWTTIFTSQANRPQVAISARRGSTTTINVPTTVANDRLYRAVIDQVGSTITGADLSILVKGKYNLD